MSSEAGTAQAAAPAGSYQWRWLAFAVVLAGSVMDLLDSLATNVAGPAIRADIGGGSTLLQWLGAGYTLAMSIGLLVGARLGDLIGRRAAFLAGMAGFTIASILCSVSSAPGELIAFRVVQGLFGAIMLPQGLGVIRASFPPQELPAAFGAFGPVMGLSSVGGPVLAGWLVSANYFGWGWRLIFLINIPIGLIAFLIGLRYLPRQQDSRAGRLDVVGSVVAAVAAGLLVYPVVQGRELGWPAWTLVMIVAGVAGFVIFGWLEVRLQHRGGDPLVLPSLIARRSFTGGLVAGLVFFTALVGFSLILTVTLQVGLHYSPLNAGLTVLPQALGSVVGFVIAAGPLAVKLGRTLIHLGTAAIALGLVGVFLTLHAASAALTPWDLIPSLAICGVGMGMVLSPFFDIVLAGVETSETGSASGALIAVQQFGSALGSAVLGTVYFNLLNHALLSDHTDHGTQGLSHAYTTSLGNSLWLAVGLQGLTFLAAFTLPRRARPGWSPGADTVDQQRDTVVGPP